MRLGRERRQKEILYLARTQGVVRINVLAEEFNVTSETIRRDLDELAQCGLVQRTYGGATPQSLTLEPQVWERERIRVAERERIGRHAAGLIEPGDAVFIDCGSTTAFFAHALVARAIPLTAVTNSIAVASALGTLAQVRVVLCGGDYVPREGGIYGANAIEFLQRFTCDKAFIGAGGLTSEGPSDADTRGVWVKRTMLRRARHGVLLVDSTKFELTQFETICALGDLDDVVSDAPPQPPLRSALAKADVQLHVAPASPAGAPAS